MEHLFHETQRRAQFEEISSVDFSQRAEFGVVSERIVTFFATARKFDLSHWEIVREGVLKASTLF